MQRGAVLGARVQCLHSVADRKAGRQHYVGKRNKAACALVGVRRSCTILSSFALHLAGGERRRKQGTSLPYFGALVLKGAMLAAAAGRAKAKAVLRFRASLLLCNTENRRYCVEHFMISFFHSEILSFLSRRRRFTRRGVTRMLGKCCQISRSFLSLRGAAVESDRINAADCPAPKLCGCPWPATENQSALVLKGTFLFLLTVL